MTITELNLKYSKLLALCSNKANDDSHIVYVTSTKKILHIRYGL